MLSSHLNCVSGPLLAGGMNIWWGDTILDGEILFTSNIAQRKGGMAAYGFFETCQKYKDMFVSHLSA